MSETEAQHPCRVQVSIEPELAEVLNPSVQAIKSLMNTDDQSSEKVSEAGIITPPNEVGKVQSGEEEKEIFLDDRDLLSEHKVLLIQTENTDVLVSTTADLAQPRPPAEKQSPSQAAGKVFKVDKKTVKTSKDLKPTSDRTTKSHEPTVAKPRTVQFAEGTTLPIIDVTPKTVKSPSSTPGQSPMQSLTATMQVIKRYECELRAQESASQRFEHKRVMISIEKMFSIVVLVQGGVMLALLAVLFGLAQRA